METVYIIDAARSAIGKFLGALSDLQATEIATDVVKGLMSRNKFDSNLINEFIAGNVLSAGIGQNPAKQVVMGSGLPDTISTANVNMVCASGMRAVAVGADSIRTGNSEISIVGGMESMSNAPYSLRGARKFQKLNNIKIRELTNRAKGAGVDVGEYELVDEMVHAGLWDCYSDLHMGALAEKIGSKYNIPRREQDEFALDSHMKAMHAIDNHKFDAEIVPIEVNGKVISSDEGVRRDTSIEKLSALKPAFEPNGTVTAGNSSQLSDGASFLILMSEKKANELGLKPLGVIESYAYSGTDPAWYGLAPTEAMKEALKRGGHGLDEMDLIELNEAFCVQALGVVKELGINKEILNVNGGATALGHPIGATGARILTTLLYALKDRNKSIGIAGLCHGGGGAAAMVIRCL